MRRSDVVTLASFPRSGNTWLRFMLANALKRDSAAEVNFGNINEYIPVDGRVNDLLIDGAPRFRKDHRTPGKCNTIYGPEILIVRDPMDTLWSYWHFINAQAPGKYPTLKSFVREYWVRFGHWGEFVMAWANAGALVVKYEDLQDYPGSRLGDCLSELAIRFNDETIMLAVAASEKAKMKSMPGQGRFSNVHDPSFDFVRSGFVWEGRERIKPEVQRIFFSEQCNREAADLMGYDVPGGEYDHAYTAKLAMMKPLAVWRHWWYLAKRKAGMI